LSGEEAQAASTKTSIVIMNILIFGSSVDSLLTVYLQNQ